MRTPKGRTLDEFQHASVDVWGLPSEFRHHHGGVSKTENSNGNVSDFSVTTNR
jgi:hypothetical protein